MTTQMLGEEFPGYWVYKLVDPRNSETFYIGCTKSLLTRFAQHRSARSSSANARLREIIELGLPVCLHPIAEFALYDDALEYEAWLISKTPGLVNRMGVK